MTAGPQGTPAMLLSPPAEMLPPGGCRGAVTGWPQLLGALDDIATDPAAWQTLEARLGAFGRPRIGGPVALCLALAASPGLLQAPAPPPDIYGHFVWVALRVGAAACTIGRSLAAVPALLQAAQARSCDGGALTLELLAGLSQRADEVSAAAGGLAARLAGSTAFRTAAVAAQAAAAAALSRAADDAVAPASGDAVQMRAISRGAGGQLRSAAAVYEAAGAEMSAASVLANLEQAMLGMQAAWARARDNLAAPAGHDANRLNQAEYWQQDMALAVAAWSEFTLQVRLFIRGLSVVRTRPDQIRRSVA